MFDEQDDNEFHGNRPRRRGPTQGEVNGAAIVLAIALLIIGVCISIAVSEIR